MNFTEHLSTSNIEQILVLKGTKTSHWQQAAIFSLSTAATLVPEMLPAVVTANLSRGAFLLRKIGVLVNHMDAIHSLGSMSVLCSDKVSTIAAAIILNADIYRREL